MLKLLSRTRNLTEWWPRPLIKWPKSTRRAFTRLMPFWARSLLPLTMPQSLLNQLTRQLQWPSSQHWLHPNPSNKLKLSKRWRHKLSRRQRSKPNKRLRSLLNKKQRSRLNKKLSSKLSKRWRSKLKWKWSNLLSKVRSSRKSKINLRPVLARRPMRLRISNSSKRRLKLRVSRNKRLRLRNSRLRSKITSSKRLLPKSTSPKANRSLSSKTKWRKRRRLSDWKSNLKRRSSKSKRETSRPCRQSFPLNSITTRPRLPRMPMPSSFRNKRRLPIRLNKLSLRLNLLSFKRPREPKKLRLMP